MKFDIYEQVETSPFDCVMWGFCCGFSITLVAVAVYFWEPPVIAFLSFLAVWAIFAARTHIKVLNRRVSSQDQTK